MHTPSLINLYDALWQALQDGMGPQLAAIGARELDPSAFMIGDPGILAGEAVCLFYAGTARPRQAQSWREANPKFELHLFAMGTTTSELEHRVMQLEYAALQVLDADPTLGGLLTTLEAGESEPVQFGKLQVGNLVHGLGLPITCQPVNMPLRPEYTPEGGA